MAQSAWAPLVPYVKARVHANDQQFGLLLFVLWCRLSLRAELLLSIWDPRAHTIYPSPGPPLFAEAGQIHTTDDVVLYPVRVPPLFGVDLDSIELHGEVDVVSSGHPCHAAQSHNLRAFDRIALVYIDPTHVAVDCLQAISMVHNNAVAIDPEGSSPNDTAVIRGLDADMLGDGEIVTEVHLLIDLLAMVDIAAHVSKGGLGLGVRLACERLMPEKPIGCLQSQVGQSLVVGLAHLSVDLDEALDGIATAIGIKLAQDLLHELVSDLDLVLSVDRLFFLGEDDGQRRSHVAAGAVGCVDHRRGTGGHVPRKGEQRKKAGFAPRHRPRTEGLVTTRDARRCVETGDVHGGQICHAE